MSVSRPWRRNAASDAGKQLADLHLNYEQLKPWPLQFIEVEGVPYSTVVADKTRRPACVSDSLTLEGSSPEVYNYRLGNRSALEWVIDEYRSTEYALAVIKSIPNRHAQAKPNIDQG